MTQALDRVRKVAKERKKEQFTALLHHVSVETLRTAFYVLKRKAAPGVDGMTWRDYEAGLEPSRICTNGSIEAPTGLNRPAGRIYRRRTGDFGRWRSRPGG